MPYFFFSLDKKNKETCPTSFCFSRWGHALPGHQNSRSSAPTLDLSRLFATPSDDLFLWHILTVQVHAYQRHKKKFIPNNS
jgi:hypothetical protein